MLTSTFLSLLSVCALTAGQTTGKLGDAPEVTSNPDAEYAAELKTDTIKGWARASSAAGKAVAFKVDVEGLPEDAGPFKYHIHQLPVPSDGNCTGTGGHLDPYERTQSPDCDTPHPETCEVGDLSGKHGLIEGTMAVLSFDDPYTSLDADNVAFFGNRSFVIHDAAGARILCANWTLVEPPAGGDDGDDGDGESCDN